MYCHPDEFENKLSVDQVTEAGKLHGVLVAISSRNPVWQAMRMFWAALTMYAADLRYSFFWIGLEALFGADDSGEITYKVAQRIAFFIARDSAEAREIFRQAKACYRMRSKIVHGRWEHDPKIDATMADTESMVRRAFLRLVNEPKMMKVFISKDRDRFLEDWVFSRSVDPPPFP